MKKVFKIIGLSLLGLLSLAVVAVIGIAIFAPGLPAYLYVKKNCPNIDVTAETYVPTATEVPADWQTITVHGITMQMPAEMALRDSSSTELTMYQWKTGESNSSNIIALINPAKDDSINLVDETKDLSQKKLEHFFGNLGQSIPTDYYTFATMLYDLQMDDFPMHSFQDSISFATFAVLKETLVTADKQYRYDTPDFRAIVTVMQPEGKDRTVLGVSFYEKEQLQTEHFMMLAAPECADAERMLISVKPEDE